MKTPNDLTQEQKEMIGLYTEINDVSFQNMPIDSYPLFVNAGIENRLHEPGIGFDFAIWQLGRGIVGGVGGTTKYCVNSEKMIHVFDFLCNLAQQENHYSNPDMIDMLLDVLEKV